MIVVDRLSNARWQARPRFGLRDNVTETWLFVRHNKYAVLPVTFEDRDNAADAAVRTENGHIAGLTNPQSYCWARNSEEARTIFALRGLP